MPVWAFSKHKGSFSMALSNVDITFRLIVWFSTTIWILDTKYTVQYRSVQNLNDYTVGTSLVFD